MRIVHTSDWHLGQTFYHFDRTYEHQCFLDWLIDALESLQADALLISGDIFDNANPSAASQKQLYRFFQTAKQRLPHLNILGIAGNHDSPARIEVPEPLLESLGAKLIGAVSRNQGEIDLERLLVPLSDKQGRIFAWCLAVPFLRPGDVPTVDTEQDAYLAGVTRLYEQLLDLALSRREAYQAIIALGHCHMLGGTVSEERHIVIGGQEALPAGLFDERIAYAALGHLHMPQKVAQKEAVRYSGSPLPMSFSEINYPHQILCVDFENDQLKSTESIRIPRFVELMRVPPKASTLPEVLEAVKALDLPECEEKPYLEVRVKLDRPEPGLRHAIETALQEKAVRLARIETTYAPVTENHQTFSDGLNRLQPEDIFRQIYRQKYKDEASDDLLQAFREILIHSDEIQDS